MAAKRAPLQFHFNPNSTSTLQFNVEQLLEKDDNKFLLRKLKEANDRINEDEETIELLEKEITDRQEQHTDEQHKINELQLKLDNCSDHMQQLQSILTTESIEFRRFHLQYGARYSAALLLLLCI
jgi:chromosome segregation ATPase